MVQIHMSHSRCNKARALRIGGEQSAQRIVTEQAHQKQHQHMAYINTIGVTLGTSNIDIGSTNVCMI